MTVVAERWKVDKAVLSRQVRQLLDWDLVEAVPCTHDGRVRILHARPAVVEIIQAHRRRGITPVGTALQQWPPEDLQRFSGYLGTLLEVADASA